MESLSEKELRLCRTLATMVVAASLVTLATSKMERVEAAPKASENTGVDSAWTAAWMASMSWKCACLQTALRPSGTYPPLGN